ETERGAVDLSLELDPEALTAVGVVDRLGDHADDLDGLGVALDRDLAVDLQLIAVAADVLGRECDLGVALGVEEVRRLEMRLEVGVLDLHARDLRGAAQHAVTHLGVEVRERARKGARQVVDGKGDVGVNLVCGPGSCGYYLRLSGAHLLSPKARIKLIARATNIAALVAPSIVALSTF